MERSDYLSALQESLIRALAETENAGWHHEPPGSLWFEHYVRLGVMISHMKQAKADWREEHA